MFISEKTGRKRRGTSVSELKSLFEQGITVKAICEDLCSFPHTAPSDDIAEKLKKYDFDVAGLMDSDSGIINGYVRQNELNGGICGDHAIPFREPHLISHSMPLINVLKVLRDSTYRFVHDGTHVNAIVTRADMQKPAVRIFLFGLITMLEMHLTELVNRFYPKDTWKRHLDRKRLDDLQDHFMRMKDRGENLDLTDLLNFSDKILLMAIHDECLHILGFYSKKECYKYLHRIRRLRNQLSHGQDIIKGTTWEEVIDDAANAEKLIKNCENNEGINSAPPGRA